MWRIWAQEKRMPLQEAITNHVKKVGFKLLVLQMFWADKLFKVATFSSLNNAAFMAFLFFIT